MQKDDLVYAGHMLDMARKAADKVAGKTRTAYDQDENLHGPGASDPGHRRGGLPRLGGVLPGPRPDPMETDHRHAASGGA